MRSLLWRLAAWLAPRDRSHWLGAMRNEEQFLVDQAARNAWLRSALAVSLWLRLTSYMFEALMLMAAMIYVDWAWGDALSALYLIAASTLALLCRKPFRIVPAVIVAGGTLPLSHAIANFDSRLWPYYQFAPLDLHDWATLALVPLPALAIALALSRTVALSD